jgi:hypothetical protein
MADGPLVPSTGVWTGQISWGPLQLNASFKVFLSRGFWQMLLDKQLLKQSQSMQDYSNDSITLTSQGSQHHICNITPFQTLPLPCLPTAIKFPSATKHPPPFQMSKEPTNVASIETTPHQDDHEILHMGDAENNALLGEVPDLAHPNLLNNTFTRLTSLRPFYSP